MLKWNVNNVETWCNVSFVLKFHYSRSHNLISCAAQIKTIFTRRSFAADLIGFHFANVSYLYKFRARSLRQISSNWTNRNKYLTQSDKWSSAFSAIWSRQENKSTDWCSLINKDLHWAIWKHNLTWCENEIHNVPLLYGGWGL